MKYQIRFTSKAIDSMAAEARWWAKHHSEAQALRWYDGFMNAIESLRDMPARCSLARENVRVNFDLHEFHYGTGSHSTHRALFRIEDEKVIILLIRRHSQSDVIDDDLS